MAKGKIFVNNESKNTMQVIDVKTMKVLSSWPLAPCDGPTGIAYDRSSNRIFSGCGKTSVVVDPSNGKVVATIANGDGVDALGWDASEKLIYIPAGRDGNVTVVHQDSPDKYTVVATVPTMRGAKTIAVDPVKHMAYLFQPEYGPAPGAGAGISAAACAGCPSSAGSDDRHLVLCHQPLKRGPIESPRTLSRASARATLVDGATAIVRRGPLIGVHCARCAVRAMVAGCGASARYPVAAGEGPHPVIPQPNGSLIPLVNYVKAKGWPAGAKPIAAEGATLTAFATGLDHPRWLYVLPNGDVLVAETNAPPRPENNKGIKGMITNLLTKRAGGAVPSANRIILLRDADGDGIAETRTVFLAGLTSPFGMVLVGNVLYVANTDAVVRFPYTPGQTQIVAPGTKVVGLPAGRDQSSLDQERRRLDGRLEAVS